MTFGYSPAYLFYYIILYLIRQIRFHKLYRMDRLVHSHLLQYLIDFCYSTIFQKYLVYQDLQPFPGILVHLFNFPFKVSCIHIDFLGLFPGFLNIFLFNSNWHLGFWVSPGIYLISHCSSANSVVVILLNTETLLHHRHP